MALSQYMIIHNNGTPSTLAAAGIGSAKLTFRANGVDDLVLHLNVSSFYGSAGFAFGDDIAIIQRDSDHPTTADVCIFAGTVEEIPRQAIGGGSQLLRYVVKGPAYGLQLCHFSQQWTYRTGAGVSTKDYEPTVCLGEDNSGNRITNMEQIGEVVDYAIAKGLNIQKGTIATGVTVPFDERQNITCWDAIVAMLRYTPDYVLHWDYSTVDGSGDYSPTLKVTAPSSMSAQSKAVTDLTAASFVPRYDIQVPGITIIFNYTDTIDGTTSRTRVTQTAGTTTDPRALFLVYDLEGVNITYLKQEVEVEDYPSDWTNAAGKAWLETQIPWLASLSSYTVNSVTGDGALSLPARLVSGSIADWMDKDQENETFTVDITYTKQDASSNVVETADKKLTFQCLSTDATSKTYRKQGDYLGPEPVPADMAANLYNSWNRLHYDGDITYKEQLCSAAILPGHKLNITGGMAGWATMNAIVQDVTLDLFGGQTDITCGTCGRLEADNLMAIFQAACGRSFCYRRESRDEPDDDSGDIPGTGSTSRSDTADGSPAEQIHRLVIRDEDDDSPPNAVVVDIDPGSISYDDSDHKAAQAIQLREIYAAYKDGDVLKGKLVQALCGDFYGDAEILGGTRPDDPTSPDEIGVATEGSSDAADTDSYDGENPGAADGVKVFLLDRKRYDHTAGTPKLYAYGRWLTFPAAIAPTVSAETRIEIDEPQS